MKKFAIIIFVIIILVALMSSCNNYKMCPAYAKQNQTEKDINS